MYATATVIEWLVTIALSVTIIAPIVFLILLIRDWKGGKLW